MNKFTEYNAEQLMNECVRLTTVIYIKFAHNVTVEYTQSTFNISKYD